MNGTQTNRTAVNKAIKAAAVDCLRRMTEYQESEARMLVVIHRALYKHYFGWRRWFMPSWWKLRRHFNEHDERGQCGICDVLNVLFYKVPKVCEGTIDENAAWWLAELADKNLCRDIRWNAVDGRFSPRSAEPEGLLK